MEGEGRRERGHWVGPRTGQLGWRGRGRARPSPGRRPKPRGIQIQVSFTPSLLSLPSSSTKPSQLQAHSLPTVLSHYPLPPLPSICRLILGYRRVGGGSHPTGFWGTSIDTPALLLPTVSLLTERLIVVFRRSTTFFAAAIAAVTAAAASLTINSPCKYELYWLWGAD